jgi:Kef-type K+ transport system membrane component KefB
MPDVHFTILLIVVAVALLTPLTLGFFPRVRLLVIVLGIAIGLSGRAWVTPDLPVSILALVGLAFLLFLSGLEIDVERLRGRILKLTAIRFAASFAIALVLGLGLGLNAAGFVKSPLFVAIVLIATSLGVIVPVLNDSGNIGSDFGQLVIAAASIADFGAIILLSGFFSGKGSTSTAGTLILLGVFGLVVVLVGLTIAGFEHSMSLSGVLRRLQDTTAQIRVPAAFVLLIGFTALADSVGLETILGAFAAGALLSLVYRDEAMTHPQFRLKLHEAIVEGSGGTEQRIGPFGERSVGAVCRELLAAVGRVAGAVEINTAPQEASWSVPLDEDEEHATYDPVQVARYFAAATQAALALTAFRAPYRGRSTPINAWWGSLRPGRQPVLR